MLTSGRCLPTCSQSQFFDKTSSSCQSCDSSCSSCSGAGPSNCLACSSSNQILRGGTCTATTCAASTSVVSGLGICLSDLVDVPTPSGTNTLPPLPSITGLDTPAPSATTQVSTTKRSLAWWEILLMALGCAFIFVVILMLWRRHARKKRAKATAKFASTKNLHRGGWRYRLVRFGEKLFGHKRSHLAYPEEPEPIRMEKLRAAEEARYEHDMDKLLDSYDYSRAGSRRGPSPLPSLHDYERDPQRGRLVKQPTGGATLSDRSLYSQVTGLPRMTAEPRQPVRTARDLLPSRFSGSSYTTSVHSPPLPPSRDLLDSARPPTPAQEYARMVSQPQPEPRGTYWLQPTNTGSSRNPFRQ